MVAKGTKRKTAEVDKVGEQCQFLTNALTEQGNMPSDVVAMLTEVIPHCLGQPKDKRHRFQDKAVMAVEHVVEDIEKRLKHNVEDARSKLLEARQRAAPSETAVVDAEQKLREDSDRFTLETKALAKAALDFRAARTAVAEAKEMQATGDADFKLAAKRKDKLQVIIDDLVEPLKLGTVLEPELDTKCKALQSALKQLDFDEAMLVVLGSSLRKTPSLRGDFDVMAIDQLDKYMAKHIQPIDETLKAGQAGINDRAWAVKAAEEALEAALDTQKLRADAFEAAWAGKKEDELHLEASRQVLKDLAQFGIVGDKELYRAEAEFDVFEEYARKAFNDLKERLAPEPVVEPVVAPEHMVEASVSMAEDAPIEVAMAVPEAITA